MTASERLIKAILRAAQAELMSAIAIRIRAEDEYMCAYFEWLDSTGMPDEVKTYQEASIALSAADEHCMSCEERLERLEVKYGIA